jgi:hypothetical protein
MKILKAISQIIGAATLLCVFGFSAHAQENDSIAFYDSRDTTLKYVSPLEYAFMMHEETKFMLRVPILGVGAELEILPYFTWMTQVHSPDPVMGPGYWILNIESELRWYYSSQKLGVRNMSGNYVAGGAKIGTEPFRFPGLGYYAKWGMQRRILGNGLADIGIVAGFNFSNDQEISGMGFFIQSPVSLGFGLVFGEKSVLDRDRLCPVVKCHEIERFLLKINFSNLININSISIPGRDHRFLAFNPQVAAEKKIFDLPLSINLNIRGSLEEYSINISDGTNWTVSGISLEWAAGGRWYYNMGRRMRLGKGGNGLSGNYIASGIGGYYSVGKSRLGESESNISSNIDRRVLPFFSTGIQRTLGERLYFDVAVGARQERHFYSLPVENMGFQFEFFGEAQIGIKF